MNAFPVAGALFATQCARLCNPRVALRTAKRLQAQPVLVIMSYLC